MVKVKLGARDARSIVSRYKKGESMIDIARDYGVGQSTVRRILTEAGVEIRPRGPRPA